MRLPTSTGQSEEALKIAVKRGKDHLNVDSEEPFPLDLKQVVHAQNGDKQLQSIVKGYPWQMSKAEIKTKIINDVEVQMYNDRIYIHTILWENVLNMYHHYLQHPSATRIERTVGLVVN